MRLVGETITIVTIKGGGRDDDGRPIPQERLEWEVPGCVVIPKGGELITGRDYTLASEDVSVLLPIFIPELEDGAELIIRGEVWLVSTPPFDHRSPFGTRRGGTEIQANRRPAT